MPSENLPEKVFPFRCKHILPISILCNYAYQITDFGELRLACHMGMFDQQHHIQWKIKCQNWIKLTSQ